MTARATPGARLTPRPKPNEPPPPARDLDGMLKRLHLPTVRRLYGELATRAEAEGMPYRAYLETLVAEEIAHRAETRVTRAVRKAQFPFLRTIDDFNFTFQKRRCACRCSAATSARSWSVRDVAACGAGRVAPAKRTSASRSPIGRFSMATRRAS